MIKRADGRWNMLPSIFCKCFLEPVPCARGKLKLWGMTGLSGDA